MDQYLQDEMRGAIFSDPDFVTNLLAIEKPKQSALNQELKKSMKNSQSRLKNSITAEHDLYKPILAVLRSIKNATDSVRAIHNLGALGTNFDDYHATIIPGGCPDTLNTKPDLVLFEDKEPTQHSWETLMMPIEVKAKHTYLKVGMKRLAQYARAVFAHQIHRRHLYGMVICKWQATFVRFDRSGIVHSPPIDMLRNFKEFQKAFAGLMMMDRRAFGYDTAFTTEYTLGGQLEYYVDLPATTVPSDGSEPLDNADCDPGQSSSHQPLPATRRFKVKERLCHRKDIRGCATIVLRLRLVKKRIVQPESRRCAVGRVTRSYMRSQSSTYKWEEAHGGRDYVLKLTWRNPNNRNEGEMLKSLEGEFGVVQCPWYSDVLDWGASCHEACAASCDECHDATPGHKVRRVKNLGDLDIQIAKEKEGKEPRYVEVDTDGFVDEQHTHRTTRIYTWTLFSIVGKPLYTAESPRQFLEAVLDAVLGYWQVFNQGILHRDISDGNVLIVDSDWGPDMRKWKSEQDTLLREGQTMTQALSHLLAESKRRAHETILQLGRDPIGFLSDFDLAATRTEMDQTSGHAVAKRTRPSDTGDIVDVGLPPKRLRRGDDTSNPSATSGIGGVCSEEQNLSPVSAPISKTHNLRDFRVGTPPFMSIRVLEIEVGTPYEHHFMDDLESFFWLILRCIVAHQDANPDEIGGTKELTVEASRILYKLDRSDVDLALLACSKYVLLLSCINGTDNVPCTMKNNLERCQNSWANNSAIVDVILNLGARFHKLSTKRGSVFECIPEVEFPKMIDIIFEGLKRL